MKYEFSKPYCPPFQPIKIEPENVEEVKTDFVSDEEVAAELGDEYIPPCSQLTYEADIRIAKKRILEQRKKNKWLSFLQVWLEDYILIKSSYFVYFIWFYTFVNCIRSRHGSARPLWLNATPPSDNRKPACKKQCIAVNGQVFCRDVECSDDDEDDDYEWTL